MPLHSRSADRIDELCPRKPKSPVPDKVADALQSQVINAFEAAIYQGMPPADALSVILSWVSSEIARVQMERRPVPQRSRKPGAQRR